MIFSLSPVYKKHDDDKNWQSNQRKKAGIIESARKILLPTISINSATVPQSFLKIFVI